MYKHQLVSLKNNLRLVMIPMPQVESVTVMVGVGAGSRFETRRTSGLFHFLEHMAFKGTQKRPSALAISSEIDGVGGEFNAFTDKELTGYYVKLAVKHQELAFDILSDMMRNSLFKAREIQREKGVIVEEINMYEDMPIQKVMEVFERLLYGDNSMGWSTAGDKKSVTGLTREDFLAVIDRLYFPQNLVIAVAGGIQPREIKVLTSKYFGPLSQRGKKVTQAIRISQSRSRIKVVSKKTEQAHFCLGVPGYEYGHPDRFVLGVMSTILGGGMSSRLFIQIRERRGLAYYVNCVPEFFTDSGYLLARAGVRLNKADEAIKVVLEEFQKLTRIRVGGGELKRAKELLKGRMILALENSQLVATRYAGQILLEEKVRTPDQTKEEIEKVTSQDILRVAKDVFQAGKFNLALIGPYDDDSEFVKVLSGFKKSTKNAELSGNDKKIIRSLSSS